MFCEQLRAARKAAGFTQLQAAMKLDTIQTQISKYETGALEPNIDTLRQLCKLYKVSADKLLEI